MSGALDARKETECPPKPKPGRLDRPRRGLRVAAGTAAQHSADVDARARFPHESIEALREQELVAACAPPSLGGPGLPVADLVLIAGQLARSCASTAMTWAMHQGQLAALCRFGLGSPDLQDLARTAVSKQWLIASATSEAAGGGNLRSSEAALEPADDGSSALRLLKHATTVSYGAEADLLLVTARRSPDAHPTDQVLAAVTPAEGTFERTGSWTPLGMRGTSSPGLRIEATIRAGNVFPVPFADIAAGAMVPLTQLLWAAIWLGLAVEALDRAVRFTRARVAREPDRRAPAALAEARWRIAGVEAQVDDLARRTQDLLDGTVQPTVSAAVRSNSLKVAASEQALEIAFLALRVCGTAGYSEQGPYSIARIIRDLSSAQVMIGNDRLLDNTAQLLLMDRRGAR